MANLDDDAGITLVEILIAILVLGVVLTAYFGVTTRNLRSLSDSRAKQEASFSASEVIETLRELPVTSARMASSYDPNLVACGGTPGEVDIYGDGSLCEQLAIDATTDIDRIDNAAPWVDSSGAVTYATYATEVAGEGVVRVTVVVDYELTNGPQQIRRSTIISEVDRG